MRGARLPVAALAALAACATVPRGGPGWSFPPAFAASQVVEVRAERGAQTLLASVWREPGRIEIAFLDPALQVPLVVARLAGGDFSEERFVEFPMPASQVESLLRDVAALYGAGGYAPADGGLAERVGRWNVSLSPPGGPEGCRFPERVTMAPREGGLPRIEVRTLEVRCGTPRPGDPVE